MKKKQLKTLKLNKSKVSNFSPDSVKGGSIPTSVRLPNGQIICKVTYLPGCTPF